MSDVAATPSPRPSVFARLLDRLDDRLNPILVREVSQALGGRGFLITAGLALLATVLIALLVAADGSDASGRGARVFAQALVPLSVIVLFIVPLQAFVSTRHEVTNGTVEHLLMSRLKPGAIVRGKLAAATVQFVLYLAIFSPLLAMTFLLRGVDVPTIAFLIATAFLFGLAASSIAVAAGALSRWPNAFRILPFAIVVVGLGSITMMAVGASMEIVREVSQAFTDKSFWMMMTTTVILTVAGMILCAMVGASALAHPYENRSTPFRVFALVGLVAGLVWMGFLIRHFATRFGSGAPETEVFWAFTAAAAAALAIFCLFATTEEERMTPRVKEQVSPRAGLALLSVPFLPGVGRGALFTLLLACLGLYLPVLLTSLFGFPTGVGEEIALGVGSWLYVLIYAGIAGLVRLRLGPGARGNWIARATLPILLLLGVLLPILGEVIVYGRARSGWEVYDVFNPFYTIGYHARYGRSVGDVLWLLALLGAVILVLLLPAMGRGVREVLAASAEKRQRAP